MKRGGYRRIGRYLMLIALILFVVTAGTGRLMAGPTSDVANTLHNFGNTNLGGFIADVSEICVFCHTPHTANTTAPLWNHYSTTAKTFTLYSSETLDPTVNAIASNLPSDSISRACLSCHDGTTAVNTLINPGLKGSNPTFAGGSASIQTVYGGSIGPGEGIWIGTNLRNMHPVGFDYAQVTDPRIKSIDVPKANGLKFFGLSKTKMECPTCHDPHVYYGIGPNPPYTIVDQQAFDYYYPFLRAKRTSSSLCLSCHDK